MPIIEELEKVLDNKLYKRENPNEVFQVFKRLEVEVSEVVMQFYYTFCGPFWEETLGIELLDIKEENNNIENNTKVCRNEYGFPKKYLVMTELCANEVVVLDSESDKLYRVDFEGGDRELLEGNLQECWNSFEEFLREYFAL